MEGVNCVIVGVGGGFWVLSWGLREVVNIRGWEDYDGIL